MSARDTLGFFFVSRSSNNRRAYNRLDLPELFSPTIIVVCLVYIFISRRFRKFFIKILLILIIILSFFLY